MRLTKLELFCARAILGALSGWMVAWMSTFFATVVMIGLDGDTLLCAVESLRSWQVWGLLTGLLVGISQPFTRWLGLRLNWLFPVFVVFPISYAAAFGIVIGEFLRARADPGSYGMLDPGGCGMVLGGLCGFLMSAIASRIPIFE